MSSRWRLTTPTELADWLHGVDVPWAIAGGWALDLWRGAPSRAHSDIEIACFRDDLPALLPHLGAFEIAIARSKQLAPYEPGNLPAPPYSLWLRRHGEPQWDFEIVAEDRDGADWRYRRHPAVRLPVSRLFTRSPGGFSVISPEVQLLYKAAAPRPKDLDDYRLFWPLLPPEAQSWLHAAISRAHPEFLVELDAIVAKTPVNQ